MASSAFTESAPSVPRRLSASRTESGRLRGSGANASVATTNSSAAARYPPARWERREHRVGGGRRARARQARIETGLDGGDERRRLADGRLLDGARRDRRAPGCAPAGLPAQGQAARSRAARPAGERARAVRAGRPLSGGGVAARGGEAVVPVASLSSASSAPPSKTRFSQPPTVPLLLPLAIGRTGFEVSQGGAAGTRAARQRPLVARQRLAVGGQIERFAVREERKQLLARHARPVADVAGVDVHEGRAGARIVADAAALHLHGGRRAASRAARRG